MITQETQTPQEIEQGTKPIRCWTVALWAAGIALLAMLPTILKFKGLYVIRGDFSEQFIPMILEYKRLLMTGTPWWSQKVGLGTGGGALVSGSPFFWLTMLFPEKWLPWAIGYTNILKFAVAACLSYLALNMFVSSRNSAIGALLYTFSGYTIINTQFLVFTDVVAVFPLLIIGIELILRQHRYGFTLFAFAVCINTLASFYMFAASSLFLFLYIVFRVFYTNTKSEKLGRMPIAIITGYLLGVALSSFVVFPKIYMVFDCARATTEQAASIKQWIFHEPLRYFELIRVFFMPSEGLVRHAFIPLTNSWTSTGIFLPLFGFAFVFVYLTRFKNWLSRLILTCLILSFIPVSNAAFSGFTNWMYTRWWFGLAFILTLATTKVLEQRDSLKDSVLRGYALISLSICGVLSIPFGIVTLYPNVLAKLHSLLKFELIQWWFDIVTGDPYLGGRNLIVTAWALCFLNYFLLFLILLKNSSHRFIMTCVAIAACANLAFFVELNNRDVINTGVESAKATNVDYLINRVVNKKNMLDTGKSHYFRIDHPHEIRNYSTFINVSSPNVFTSIRTKHIAVFEDLTNCSEVGAVTSIMPFNRPALRSLLSVKYFVNFDPEDFVLTMPGYKLVKKTDTHIYENQYYVPMGLSYDTYISENQMAQYKDCIEKLMLKAVVLSDEQIEKYGGDMHKFASGPAKCNDFDWMTDALEMKKHACTDYTADSTGFAAKIELDAPRMVFFSIPYGAGWSAFVDGQPAQIEKVNIGFLGLMLPAGQHNIEFRYFPPGLKLGAIVSGISAIILLCYFIISARMLKRKKGGELAASL